jgi:hypothetical protein
MTDLIIGSIKDYDVGQIAPYIHSITRTGYTGDRVMFVNNVTAAARRKLEQYCFKVIDGRGGSHGDFLERERFYAPIDFLKANASAYRYVIWSDVRDLIFQTNPSVWMEANAGPYKLFGAGECILIKNQSLNNWWIARGFDHGDYRWLRQHQVCCGGTLAGTADFMRDALIRILDLSIHGINDQAAMNFMLRTSPFKEVAHVPKMAEGFCCTCSQFLSEGDDQDGGPEFWTDDPPVFSKTDGLVYTPDGKTPFMIVHQYDRSGGPCDRDHSWRGITEEKYKD